MTEPKPSEKTLGELAAEKIRNWMPDGLSLSETEFVAEIIDQLDAQRSQGGEWTVEPCEKSIGLAYVNTNAYCLGEMNLSVAKKVCAACCGCAGLREALEKISKGTRWNPLNSTGRSPSWDAQTALEALAQPCTCQGATGEEQELIAEWAALLHRPSISEDSLRDGLTKFAAALRRVQERKEV